MISGVDELCQLFEAQMEATDVFVLVVFFP